MKITFNEVLRETDKAILLETPVIWGGMEMAEEVWFPRSQVSNIHNGGEEEASTIEIADWLFASKQRELTQRHGQTVSFI